MGLEGTVLEMRWLIGALFLQNTLTLNLLSSSFAVDIRNMHLCPLNMPTAALLGKG